MPAKTRLELAQSVQRQCMTISRLYPQLEHSLRNNLGAESAFLPALLAAGGLGLFSALAECIDQALACHSTGLPDFVLSKGHILSV